MVNEPLRMCCVCREKKSRSDLLRFTLSLNSVQFNEGKQKIFGRSAYICKCEHCINEAIKKRSLNRAFHRDVPQEVYNELTKFL